MMGEGHLRRVAAKLYNRSRCHLSLERNVPEPWEVESGRAIAHLGGLHHRYTRAALPSHAPHRPAHFPAAPICASVVS